MLPFLPSEYQNVSLRRKGEKTGGACVCVCAEKKKTEEMEETGKERK